MPPTHSCTSHSAALAQINHSQRSGPRCRGYGCLLQPQRVFGHTSCDYGGCSGVAGDSTDEYKELGHSSMAILDHSSQVNLLHVTNNPPPPPPPPPYTHPHPFLCNTKGTTTLHISVVWRWVPPTHTFRMAHPFLAARCNGVIPILSCRLTVAPLLIRYTTHSVAPVLLNIYAAGVKLLECSSVLMLYQMVFSSAPIITTIINSMYFWCIILD